LILYFFECCKRWVLWLCFVPWSKKHCIFHMYINHNTRSRKSDVNWKPSILYIISNVNISLVFRQSLCRSVFWVFEQCLSDCLPFVFYSLFFYNTEPRITTKYGYEVLMEVNI
jgi:hypothetical protein